MVAGITETRAAVATGLAVGSPSYLSAVAPGALVPATAASTRTTYLQIASSAHGKLPQVQTLCLTVTQGSPAAGAVQLIVEGRDENGQPQVETTPLVATVAKTTNRVYLARLFSVVTLVAYRGTFSAGATCSLGPVSDLSRAATGSLEHIAPQNLGWWTGRETLGDRSDPVLATMLYSHTTSKLWVAKTGAVKMGYTEPGWVGSRDKWGLDWSLLIQADTGAAPTYSPGDIVQMLPVVLGHDPLGA